MEAPSEGAGGGGGGAAAAAPPPPLRSILGFFAIDIAAQRTSRTHSTVTFPVSQNPRLQSGGSVCVLRNSFSSHHEDHSSSAWGNDELSMRGVVG
jgi:hypothetical protein